jgi:hypothetical protein
MQNDERVAADLSGDKSRCSAGGIALLSALGRETTWRI